MWNGKRYKNPGSGLVENHNRPSRFISSNFDDLSANNHLEISNREFKWDDPQKKLSADLRAWSLSQSTSCPDFFQKLAAGKVSPAESVEAEQMHAQPPTRPKVPLSDGTMLRKPKAAGASDATGTGDDELGGEGGAVAHGPRFFGQPTCHHRPDVYAGLGEAESAAMLRDFFARRR